MPELLLLPLLMKFSQLRAIVAVAARGNFSKAALELQLSQPEISYAIATGLVQHFINS